MRNFIVSENECVFEELRTNLNIQVGDCIEYICNNQEGYRKYRVVLENQTNEKALELISTNYFACDDNDEEEEEQSFQFEVVDDFDDIKEEKEEVEVVRVEEVNQYKRKRTDDIDFNN